eukprot:TRINITY_DN14420_c0_g1_i1.p1 TRINITY_DN14420_c0_g1~~TRINITY_DN14420_c0_g1_i1.p1  ORF type:complete len:271 (+),score=60.87 TRINITY_DN14420_c0_g1_i1:38-850(+)
MSGNKKDFKNDNEKSSESIKGLKIIGAGFGRTSTTSTYDALNFIGYKCYHMKEVFKYRKHSKLWYRKSIGEEIDFSQIFDDYGYKACVDFPASVYYKELMEKYPNAKVILNVRNPESWHKSCISTIYRFEKLYLNSYSLKMLCYMSGMIHLPRMAHNIVWSGLFDDKLEDKSHAIQVFNDHIDEVKQTVPEERLLVFDVKKHGYKELCRFLDVDPPVDDNDEIIPFPHVNTSKDISRKIDIIEKFFYTLDYILLVAIVVIVVFGYFYFYF